MSINTIFQTLERAFETPIRNFIDQAVSNVASGMTAPLNLMLLIYIVSHGYALASGRSEGAMTDFVWKAAKAAIIVQLVTRADTFNTFVTGLFFEGLPQQVGAWLGGSGTINGSAFDNFAAKGLTSGVNIWQQAGITNPGPAILAILVFLVVLIAAGIAFAFAMYAKLALAVVIALGPMAIACALFPVTRRITESWMGQLINFVVLQLLIVTVLSLVMSVAGSTTTVISGNADPFIPALANSAIFIVSTIMILFLPALASGVSGGGVALAAETAGRMMGGGALSAARLTGQGSIIAGAGAQRASATASSKMWAGASIAASKGSNS